MSFAGGGTIPKPPVVRILATQVLLALVLSGVIYVAKGKVDGYSLLLGCATQIAGFAYCALRAFRVQGATRAATAVGQMYLGVTGKLVLSGVLFALVFALVRPISAIYVFAGFILMQVVQVAMAAVVGRR